MVASKTSAIYVVGFAASALTGLMCIYVAGFAQKISGLGGWRKAVDSAAPIALFLLIKIFILDPLLFWSTGKVRSALNGKDANGKHFTKFSRLYIMSLLLLGSCLLTQLVLSLGEEVQEYGLRRIMPPTAVVVENTRPYEEKSGPKKDDVRHNKPTDDLPNQTSKRDEPATKPFNLTDVLKSFNLLIADFYSHSFLLLNGATCFFLLLWLLQFVAWTAAHVDQEVLPRFIFTAISSLISCVSTVLLLIYQVLANQ